MILAAVDPGLRHTGVSFWADGVLTGAMLVKNTEAKLRGPPAWLAMAREVQAQYPLGLDTLVVELQQRDRRNFNPDDLYQVAGVTGALVGMYDGRCTDVVGYYPREWSRVEKGIRHTRLKQPGVLTNAEWTTVEKCAKNLEHNLLDAVCLGLFHLKRVGYERRAA